MNYQDLITLRIQALPIELWASRISFALGWMLGDGIVRLNDT
jgi:hypothetical protein